MTSSNLFEVGRGIYSVQNPLSSLNWKSPICRGNWEMCSNTQPGIKTTSEASPDSLCPLIPLSVAASIFSILSQIFVSLGYWQSPVWIPHTHEIFNMMDTASFLKWFLCNYNFPLSRQHCKHRSVCYIHRTLLCAFPVTDFCTQFQPEDDRRKGVFQASRKTLDVEDFVYHGLHSFCVLFYLGVYWLYEGLVLAKRYYNILSSRTMLLSSVP